MSCFSWGEIDSLCNITHCGDIDDHDITRVFGNCSITHVGNRKIKLF